MRVWNKWIHIVWFRDRRSQRLFVSLPSVSCGQKTLSTARANARFVTRSGGMEERKSGPGSVASIFDGLHSTNSSVLEGTMKGHDLTAEEKQIQKVEWRQSQEGCATIEKVTQEGVERGARRRGLRWCRMVAQRLDCGRSWYTLLGNGLWRCVWSWYHERGQEVFWRWPEDREVHVPGHWQPNKWHKLQEFVSQCIQASMCGC